MFAASTKDVWPTGRAWLCMYVPNRPGAGDDALKLRAIVEFAVRHDCENSAGILDIVQWIGIQYDEVGEFACANAAELTLHGKPVRGKSCGALESCAGCHANFLDEDLQFVKETLSRVHQRNAEIAAGKDLNPVPVHGSNEVLPFLELLVPRLFPLVKLFDGHNGFP
jgi:hypothetical protein